MYAAWCAGGGGGGGAVDAWAMVQVMMMVISDAMIKAVLVIMVMLPFQIAIPYIVYAAQIRERGRKTRAR